VKYLVEQGARLDILDNDSTTPLWWACSGKKASFTMIAWILD